MSRADKNSYCFGGDFKCFLLFCSDSCKDIYTNDHNSKNGTYTIHNRENKPYQVYCEFYYKYGYTYISRQTSVDFNINDLFTTTDHVKVRHIAGNGFQTETILENIESHKNLSLGLFYNRHIGYAMPINIEHLAPYLYVGFLPIIVASHMTVQGYRAAKQNVLFTNCDSNPNSYFVFYFNPKQTANEGYGSGWGPSAFMTEWMVLGSAIPAEHAMPPEFFFDYEIHFGGCGGYMFRHRLDNKEGAALGLRFGKHFIVLHKIHFTYTSIN